ncbi:MAG: hypothetical protein HQL13_05195 [Candidatus Omnitrophica bacterium]|nr:hypothetical protein [Candidatus Omnitrophota bacterium]
MILFIILGVVVMMALCVLGGLFYMLSQEAQKKEEAMAVPVTDIKELNAPEIVSVVSDPKPVENLSEAGPIISSPDLPSSSVLEGDAYRKRSQMLEDELLAISKKASNQSDEARQMIASLTKENEELKAKQADLNKAQEEILIVQAQADRLKNENNALQTQLDSTNARVYSLETEMASLRIKMEEEITKAQSIPTPVPDQALIHELESLKSEYAQFKEKYDDLDNRCHELTLANTQLIEKNDLLQYELVKAKAQSSGLERVSFNYKAQLEDFLKKIHLHEASNDKLSNLNNRLEGMVEEIKLKNEELEKQEQLTKFELEQNRLRMVNLEHECANLRSRVQQS